MILESAMIAIAAILLTVFHPALVFGSRWQEADFRLGGNTVEIEHGVPMEKGWKSVGSGTPINESQVAVFGATHSARRA